MSLDVQPQVSLKAFNSFGIDVRAQWFAEAHSDADVREGLAYAAAQQLPLLVIGGGSNLLLTQDIPALVLRMATQGIRVLHDDGQQVVVEAEAGEAVVQFVLGAHAACGVQAGEQGVDARLFQRPGGAGGNVSSYYFHSFSRRSIKRWGRKRL